MYIGSTEIIESKNGCNSFSSMGKIETFPKEMIQQICVSFEKITMVCILIKVAKKEDLLSGLITKNMMQL